MKFFISHKFVLNSTKSPLLVSMFATEPASISHINSIGSLQNSNGNLLFLKQHLTSEELLTLETNR